MRSRRAIALDRQPLASYREVRASTGPRQFLGFAISRLLSNPNKPTFASPLTESLGLLSWDELPDHARAALETERLRPVVSGKGSSVQHPYRPSS